MFALDEIFDMHQGYVLNFSDRTFAQFFAEDLNIDIEQKIYYQGGTSKAKRLRYFLQTVDKATAAKTLKALWNYREALRNSVGEEETIKNANGRFLQILNKLEGIGPSSNGFSPPPANVDRDKFRSLKDKLIEVSNLTGQTRGYAFEDFLIELFASFGLKPREPFKLKGEQIDGSFDLQSHIYLLEAKWTNDKIGNADLHSFHGKLEQKAAWTRGLFISFSGFTEDGLFAFGRGKRAICMDGLDLYDALDREIPINHVIEAKVRIASETGNTFVLVRDLFPK